MKKLHIPLLDIVEGLVVVILLAVLFEFVRPGVLVGSFNVVYLIVLILLASAYLLRGSEQVSRRHAGLAIVVVGAILLVVPNVSLLLRFVLALVTVTCLFFWNASRTS